MLTVTVFDYRELESAGFTSEQTTVLKRMVEATAPHDEMIEQKIDAAETRLEKVFIQLMSEVKKDINAVSKDINELRKEIAAIHTRLARVEANLGLIKSAGGLFISAVTIASTIFGVLHVHLAVS